MKAIGLAVALVVLVAQMCDGYDTYQRPSRGSYSSDYRSSSSYSSSSSSSLTSCCQFNSWAFEHIDEIRQFAYRLSQEYKIMSQGSSTGHPIILGQFTWNDNIIQLTGKSAAELNLLCHLLSEQLVNDMRKGLLAYTTIAQPQFFEWKSAELLESIVNDLGEFPHRKEKVDFDDVKNFAYPAEVKVIGDKTYIVHNNCTQVTQTLGDGITSQQALPSYSGIYGTTNHNGYSSGAMVSDNTMGSSTTTRKKTIHDWVNQNIEPSVVGYRPSINLQNTQRSRNMEASYMPSVHIPITGDAITSSDVETFATGTGPVIYRPFSGYGPSSTVTINRYNKTIYTRPDGSSSVEGSRSTKKWVDGKLVIDNQRPFGDSTVPRDEDWKREERERFFWFLSQGNTSPQSLEAWQRQQEERIISLAQRYQTSVQEIQEWHCKELERYRSLLLQYQGQFKDMTAWQQMERGRLDWLIHQNSVTREELERWQRENNDRLVQLARQYNISINELKQWQLNELQRLYLYFNKQNNSMITSQPSESDSLTISEQERVDAIIREHNATMTHLQNSIKVNQQIIKDLAKNYRGNVQDMEKWLKDKLSEINGAINKQNTEMNRITEWQKSERSRLENIMIQHRGSIEELNAAIARDRVYLQTLATKYHVSLGEIEKWQRAELSRMQNEGKMNFELELQEWQKRERDYLMQKIHHNHLSIEEFQSQVMNDRARLQNLANIYQIQVSEVEEWIKNEIENLKNQGLLKEVEKELALWQRKERERLLAIVKQHELSVKELEELIQNDSSHLFTVSKTYQVRIEEIEDWLKKEVQRLQSQGLIKAEDLKQWQQHEREELMKIVQQNRMTIEEFERKLLSDRSRLQDISMTYNIKINEVENWIKQEGERLQSMGLLKMQEKLNNWQKIERDRLLSLINKNNLTIHELEERIDKDQVHLYSLAHQHQVRVEEIEDWIKNEIKILQEQGLIEMQNMKEWQLQWRGNLTNMVMERDFTVEQFHKWLLEDRSRLQELAMQHNVQIEEIEQWVKNEEQRFISMGLLKPNEHLTNWQEVERTYLEKLTQQQYQSTEQLEQRLRQDRELLEKLAREYSVQVTEIDQWMKEELARLRDEGRLQIENLTSWQIAERERLEALIKMNNQWSVEELEANLKKDREHMQTMAFQYHTSVEEIEKFIKSEVNRLTDQGKINIEQLTAWQKEEQTRILKLLQEQSRISVEEFETKVRRDRDFVKNLANQYHVSVVEVEKYVKKVIDDLKDKGKFEVENLQQWQLAERHYILQLIEQYKNSLSTSELEKILLNDREHLQQLSKQYKVNITKLEQWMLQELQRLRANAESQVNQMVDWQLAESQRLKELLKKNNHITYVQFEVELLKDNSRLQQLSKEYSVSIDEIERWLKQQLLNLKVTGEVTVENLNVWQEDEQKHIIDLFLSQENNANFEELQLQLLHDQKHLAELSEKYRINVQQIEVWMKAELQRLRESGLLEMKNLSQWQVNERQRLQKWLKEQINGASMDQLNEFLKRDKLRLERIASQYHLTVGEVEDWVMQEAARLEILGLVSRPENLVFEPFPNNEEVWKAETEAHLQGWLNLKPRTMQDFEHFLNDKRLTWEQKAHTYHVSVEDIEAWLRIKAEDLKNNGIIQGLENVEVWQRNERIYIQNLLNQRGRQRQKWSIEELERFLKNNQDHLQQLVLQYKVSIETICDWYRVELQRLLNQHRIVSENLTKWQEIEKERIYRKVLSQPQANFQYWEQDFLHDADTLKRLANEYHVTVNELKYFIRIQLRRLMDLGLIVNSNGSTNLWKELERQRLKVIATDISITSDEFLNFLEEDKNFQSQLSSIYGCKQTELAPHQRIFIQNMLSEGLLDRTVLLILEPWQRIERDRLYSLIKSQNFNKKNLLDMHRSNQSLYRTAELYGITLQRLKDWQIQEFDRLMKLAEHYNMSLMDLQHYREKELQYITYVMHKKISSEQEQQEWRTSEAKRLRLISEKTGLNGDRLFKYRRLLFLYSQGLLKLNLGSGGIESNGTTNVTNIVKPLISKDRGDQPPNNYEEEIGEEPKVAGENNGDITSIPPGQLISTTAIPHVMVPNGVPPTGGALVIESGYRYTKKEMNKPIMGVATAVATADMSSSSANASVNGGYLPPRYPGRYHREREMTDEDEGQKQQQDAEDDFGQQQQQEVSWNGHLTRNDVGQQQVQVEDLSGIVGAGGVYGRQHFGHGGHRNGFSSSHTSSQSGYEDRSSGASGDSHLSSDYRASGHSSGSYANRHQQQQVELESDVFGQQQQVELNDYKQEGHDQQQHVEDISGRFTENAYNYGSNEKQVSKSETQPSIEVTAKPESTVWSKLNPKNWFH